MNVKHRHLLRKGLLMLTMALVLLLVMIPATTQEAAAAEVSGTIYASNINASEHHLVLTGHTTLILDRDLVLKTISGEFSLVVKGSGSLTVSADFMESDAISVASLDVQTNLYVSSTSKKHCSIYATGSISLTGGSVTVKGASGIRSKNGNVTIGTADLKVEATSGVSIIANEGSVDIDAAKLNVETQGAENHGISAAQNVTVKSNEGVIIGKDYGVYAQEGYIEMKGTFSIGADKYGVYAPKGTVTMEGTFYVNGTVNAIRHDGPKDIRLNGDFTLRSAKDSTIYTPGYLYVDGKLDVRCDNSKDYALKILSSINIKGSVCKIDASGGGIFSQYGDIRITSTEIKVTGAVMAGIVSRSQGSVYLNGDQITVLCASPILGDDQFHNGIYAKGSVSVSVTGLAWVEGREGIVAETGNINLYGGGEHQVQGLGNALRGQEIRATGTLKVKTTNKSGEPYAIKSTMFAFDGDVLEVTSTGGGIQAKEGGIIIEAKQVTVIAEGKSESICALDDSHMDSGDISVTCESGTINGRCGVYSCNNITLNGNIYVESFGSNAVYARWGNVTMTGNITVNCRNNDDDGKYGILCGEDFKFNGTMLDVWGGKGIEAKSVYISGSAVIYGEYGRAITSDTTLTIEKAETLKIDVYLGYPVTTVYANGDIRIDAKEAVIGGGNQAIESSGGNITLNGNFEIAVWVPEMNYGLHGIYASGDLSVNGSLIMNTRQKLRSILCDNFTFTGTKLYINERDTGYGIQAREDINITADSVEIYVKDGHGIRGKNVTIDSDYLWIQSDNKDNNVYPSAVEAENNVIIRSSDVTLVGRYAIYSWEGNVELEGTFAIGAAYDGVSAPKGYVKLNGSFLIQAGNIGVKAAESVSFSGKQLNITAGSNCIEVSAGDLSLDGTVQAITNAADKIGIYAYGNITLAGNVTVTTAGYEGIKAEGTVTLNRGHYKVTGCKTNYRAIYGVTKLVIDPAMKIVVPEGGYNNGTSINTTKGTRATEVEIYAAISTSDVSIYIDTPTAGKTPPTKTYQIQGLGGQLALDSITWYEDGVKMTEGQMFVAGKTYTVDLVLVSTGGEMFTMGDMAKVNGKSVSTGTGGDKLYLSGISLGKCSNAIGKVELTVTAPLEGNTPSTTVGANTGYGKDSIQWQVSTNGRTYTNMSTSAKFESGKYYRVIINVRTSADNYKFAVNGTQPDVEAVVNGYSATVSATAGKDAARYITVTYDFGICNDSVVENITITNIDAPVAGQTPDYMANCFGTGYSMAGTNSGNWKVNGIVWLRGGDIYTGSIMDKTEKFQPGHEYTVMIDLVADNGYTFLFNHNNSIYATTSINGNTAQIAIDNCSTTKYQVWYTFTCQQKTVDRIEINDIDYPASGKAPDYTAIEGNPGEYLLDTTHGTYNTGIFWYDCEGRMMEKGETFRKGETYLIELRIISPQSDGADLVKFANDVRVFINGTEVNTYGWWDDIEVNANIVHVYFTFRNPAAAPELGVSVMGVINGNGSATKPEVKLYAEDDTGFTKPLYTATVGEAMPGENGTFNWVFMFSDLPKGDYYLVITKTAHKQYSMLVGITGDGAFPDPMILIPVACTHSGGTATCLAPAVCTKCGEPYGEKNSKNHAQEVSWMCGAANHTAYYGCCRTYEITDQPHTWKNGVCSVCGYECGHTGGTATCTSKAVCTTCGAAYGETDMYNHTQEAKWEIAADHHKHYYPCCQEELVVNGPHAFDNYGICFDCGYVCKHNLSVIQGMPVSCTSDGVKDCYQCGMCWQYFEDQAATKRIDDYSTWSEGPGKIIGQHTYGDLIPRQEPIHTQHMLSNGMKAHYRCEVCQEYFDENKNPCGYADLSITVEPHSFGPWNTSDPDSHWKSCECGLRDELGAHVYANDNDMICDTCGYDRTVPHVHGNGQKVDGQAAGCTENGWKEYYQCECGEFFADSACTNPIADLSAWKQGDGKLPAQHSYGELILKVEADCTKNGMQAHYKCGVCDTLFDENKQVKTQTELTIPMDTEHSYGQWKSNGDGTHTRVCNLSSEHKQTLPCSGGVATCTQKAVCEDCGSVYGDTLPHEHGADWTSDQQEHWNACACGDKANVSAHADADQDGKCDICSYDMGTEKPTEPTQPTQPTQPTEPNQPTKPSEPGEPTNPAEPTQPGGDIGKQEGPGTGAIFGIAVGCTLAVCAAAFLVYLFAVKKRKNK